MFRTISKNTSAYYSLILYVFALLIVFDQPQIVEHEILRNTDRTQQCSMESSSVLEHSSVYILFYSVPHHFEEH